MIRILLILVLLSTTMVFSQEKTFEKEVKKISKTIDKITKTQKDSLKEKVRLINAALAEEKITPGEAKKQKKQAAEYHAKEIARKVGIQEYKLQQLVQDKTDGKIASSDDNAFTVSFFEKDFVVFETNRRKKKFRGHRDKRTTTQIVFAMGVNNVLENNQLSSLNDSKYKFWQSHFYEIGFTFKTRMSKLPSKTYFKYGLSFLWNNLRAKNNQYHVLQPNSLGLQVHGRPLSESRLRHVQMTFPMHLEFDFTDNKVLSDKRVIDDTHDALRIGIGGFFGFKLGTRQYLEYVNAEGIRVEEVQKGDFNMNTINYGLSTYVAYQGIGLYVKYDLNPLFKNSKTRNIAMGVRLDIN